MKFTPTVSLFALLLIVSGAVAMAQVVRPPAGRAIHPTQIPSPPTIVSDTVVSGQTLDDPLMAPAPPRTTLPSLPQNTPKTVAGSTDVATPVAVPQPIQAYVPPSVVRIAETSEEDTMDTCLATLAKLRIEQKDLAATLALIAKMNNPTAKAKTLTELAEYIAHDPDFKQPAAVLFDEAVKATLALGNLTPADIPELKPQTETIGVLTSIDPLSPSLDISQGRPETPQVNEPPIPATPEPNLDSPLGDLDINLGPEPQTSVAPTAPAPQIPAVPTPQPAAVPAPTPTVPAIPPAAVPSTPTSRPMPRAGSSRPTPRPTTTPTTTPTVPVPITPNETLPTTAPAPIPATPAVQPAQKPDPLQDMLDAEDDEVEAPGSN